MILFEKRDYFAKLKALKSLITLKSLNSLKALNSLKTLNSLINLNQTAKSVNNFSLKAPANVVPAHLFQT